MDSTWNEVGNAFLADLNGSAGSPVWSVYSRKLAVLTPIETSTFNHIPGQMGPRRYS
jgi:hypothetical protein